MSTENFKIQIRKGLLEFCVLQIISKREVYASEIIEELKNSKIIVVEGTVYPLLSRLKKSDYIKHEWKESSQGPPRKYYSITDSGFCLLYTSPSPRDKRQSRMPSSA